MLQTKLSRFILLVSVMFFMFIIMFSSTVEAQQMYYSSLNVGEQKLEKEKSSNQRVDQAKIEKIRLKKLTHIAEYFGIKTEGKTIEQLKVEIEQAKQNNPEKWALLKEEIHKKKLKMLQQR